jgi:hypothetical protein
MKKITTVALGLVLLVLWNGWALAADTFSKPPFTQLPQTGASTTPGIAVRGAFVDLAVTEISVQELGQGALIQVTVKNLGTAAANANLYRLRVLQDGTSLPGEDQPLFNVHSPIGPNQTRVTGIVPTKSGRTRVTATLIPTGAATGDNPANNSLELTLNLPEVLPDFTVVDLSLTADNLIRVTIRNQGGYTARDARGKLEVYVGNDRVDSIAMSQWPNPGETKVITSTARIAGRQNVRATVNPDRAVREANLNNNTFARELTAHAFKPDLIVKNLDRWKELPSRRNLAAATKLVVVIANIGRAPSPPVIRADVFRAGRILDTLTLQGPIANATEKRFETGIRIEGGNEYRVMVDPLNAIDEEREDNNYRNEQSSDPLTAEIFIPSGDDVRRSGLPMP